MCPESIKYKSQKNLSEWQAVVYCSKTVKQSNISDNLGQKSLLSSCSYTKKPTTKCNVGF